MAVGDHHLPVTYDDVVAAARRLSGVANRTPVFTSRELNRRLIVHELVECEGLTPVHPYDDPRIMAGAGTSTLVDSDRHGGRPGAARRLSFTTVSAA